MKVSLLSQRKILNGWGAAGLAKLGFGVIKLKNYTKTQFCKACCSPTIQYFSLTK